MASNYNLRGHNTIGPPEPTIPCLEPGCIRHFYNRTGRSNHIRSKHPQFVPDPQQQANASTFPNSVPSQVSSADDDLSSSPSGSTVSSNSHSRSRGGDESIDGLGDNFNVDTVFDGGYERDDHRSSGNQTREPSAARSNNWAHDSIIPRINRTNHPIINGQLRVLTVTHIYFIFRNNL